MKNDKIRKNLLVFGFLLIPMILLFTFTYYSSARLIQLSFTDWNGISKTYNNVGLDNYIEVLTNVDNYKVFAHNLAYLIMGIIQNILGLLLAIILNEKIKGKNIFRTVVLLPYLMNGIAIAYMFSFLYHYDTGALNVILRFFGLKGVQWLGNAKIVNYSLAFILVWKFTGYNMMIFLGALQSVDTQIYEACELDGANFFQKLWYITYPCIKRTVELSMFLSIAGAAKAFNEAFAMTNGGPNGASLTYVFKVMNTAFTYNNYGLASAMGVVLMIVLIILTVIQKKFISADD